MSFLEYAPAPESRAILNLRDEYGLFIDGEFRPGHGGVVRDDLARRREAHRDDRHRRAKRMSTPPSPPRAAPTTRRGRS